jgi:YD repeat-containing protein
VVSAALVGSALGGVATTSASAATNSATSTPAGVQVVTNRPDAYAAMMAAKKQGSRVEVLDDRTDASQTFANPDGSFSYETSADPRWVKQGSAWGTLDATLKVTASGSYTPMLSESPLVLSGGGTGPLATMTVDGKQLTLTWPSALPKPTLSGATLTYPDVLASGVDLQVTATPAGGAEETLVVKNATAAADPALADLVQATATSTGATLAVDAGGNLAVRDTKGDVLVTSPTPVMWDSSTSTAAPTTSDTPNAASTSTTAAGGTQAEGLGKVALATLTAVPGSRSTAHEPGTRAHQARVNVKLIKHQLHLAPDQAMLTSKNTVFPIYVDPAYVPHPASGSTLNWDEVQQGYPTTSNYDAAPGSGLAVGYQGFSSPTGIERTYYNLSVPTSIYGSTVISATLNTTVTYAATSGSNTDTVNVYSTCAISSSTTWNSQPCHDSSVNPNYPNPVVAKSFTTTSQSPNLAVSFNVQPSMQLLANGSHNNWTIGLYNSTETNDVDLVRFADNPTFSITYNNPPATPTNLSLTPSNVVGSTTYTSTGTPTLSASSTDANSDTVRLDYQILSGSTVKASGSTAFVNSGTAATWKPTTALADGAYTWQVRAYDGHDYSAWTTAKAFTIDTSTPPAPSVSCAAYPANAWTQPVTGGSACTFTDSSTDVSGYTYSLDGGTSSTVAGSTGSITLNPGSSFDRDLGWHTLSVLALSNAATAGTATAYNFGLGTVGISSPADQSTSSTTFQLGGSVNAGLGTTTTFQYRVGTSGAFTTIPAGDVTSNGNPITWPVADGNEVFNTTVTSVVSGLTWNAAHTLNDDGLIQIQAIFTNGSNSWTTTPTTVTLDRVGTGVDFSTTQAGPVTVGLQSGNASLSATDVSIASFGSGLSLSRTFNSLKPTASGIFGPGWTSSLPVAGTSASWSSITDDGTYALLIGQDGSKLTFATGTVTSGVTAYTPQGPASVAGLTLTKNSAGFTLTDGTGTQVLFAAQAGGIGGQYRPATVTQPGTTSSTGYVYDGTSTSSTYGKLMMVVAPDANALTGTSSTTACPYPASASTWGAGCRGLQLTYDPATGNLAEADFVTSDGTTLTKTAVADYTYDASGRLVAQWDPRIIPALKTTYTYDETSGDADFGRLTQISPAQSATGSLAPWVLAYNDSATSADYGKFASVSRTHNTTNGGGTAKTVIAYSVPLTVAAGGPADMDATTIHNGWGQSDAPTSAVAVFPEDHAPTSTPPSDWTYAQILYYDAQGREVNTASFNNSWNITTTEYDQYGNDIRELTAANRATALAAGSTSVSIAGQLDTENVYSTDGTQLLDAYGPAHQATAAGSLQIIRTHTHNTYDQGAPNGDKDANGNPYNLVTSSTVTASLGTSVPGSSDVDGHTTQNNYNNGSDTEGWALHTPLQTVTDPGTGHLGITKTVAYNENTSLYGGAALQISSSQPSDTSGTGAGSIKTIYYTAGSNSTDSSCGNQPAWADLVCKTEPAAQPSTSGLPSLAVIQYSYNAYLEATVKTETFGSSTRTSTVTYDVAGRPVRSSITTSGSGMGTAVQDVVTAYDTATGLTSDTETVDGNNNVTANLHAGFDDFGQLASYTDATDQATNYSYDLAGRVTGRSDAHGTTTISYNGGSVRNGLPTSESDSLAGTFSASYNADGKVASQTYPGGTVSTYTYDFTGQAVQLSYTSSNWAAPITDSITTNAGGDWTSRSLLNASQVFSYDAADRITSAADTESGQCTTRIYSYDADSNRLGSSVASPNTDGTCQTSTSATLSHSYDSADRATDAGVSYDSQGDITTLPGSDTGGANLSSTYYVNGMVNSQSQSGTTYSWQLDTA